MVSRYELKTIQNSNSHVRSPLTKWIECIVKQHQSLISVHPKVLGKNNVKKMFAIAANYHLSMCKLIKKKILSSISKVKL